MEQARERVGDIPGLCTTQSHCRPLSMVWPSRVWHRVKCSDVDASWSVYHQSCSACLTDSNLLNICRFVLREAGGVSMYYEPHCDAQASALQRLDPVDIIVTPAVNQMLISFPLVSFCEAACFTAWCGGTLLCTVAPDTGCGCSDTASQPCYATARRPERFCCCGSGEAVTASRSWGSPFSL